MKNIRTIIVLALFAGFVTYAQTPKTKKELPVSLPSKATTKPHTCNDGCTNKNHNYKHGETGHVCDANCQMGKMDSTKIK